MTKPVKIDSPAALEAAKEYGRLYEQFKKAGQDLTKRQEREAKELVDEYNKEFARLYQIMGKDVLPDPVAAFYNNTHYFVIEYAEYGMLFLREFPKKNQESEDQPEDSGGGPFEPLRKIVH